MFCDYSNETIAALNRFIGVRVLHLKQLVYHGTYPDLYAAIKSDAERLRLSRVWVAEQMKTTEGYAALRANGFTQVLIIDAFNGALLAFYERALFEVDTVTEEPLDMVVVCSMLLADVTREFQILKLDDSGAFER